MTSTSDSPWLTQEAYDQLKAELSDLTGTQRAEVARRIEAARAEGDLAENGGYHAAKEAQGHLEARIRQLQHLLDHAQVGEPPAAQDGIAPGMVVEVRYADDPDDSETFLLGSREMRSIVGDDDLTVMSPQSPLGEAVLGAQVGDEVDVTTPRGSMTVTVLRAEPYTG